MISLSVEVFFLIYLGAGFLLLFGIWFYYDWRDCQLHAASKPKVIFHCVKCSQIYTGPPESSECNCPRCGFNNGRLQF